MTEITLVIGSDISCADGFRGEVRCVVVDPSARTVTHLVVEPKGRLGLARLIPLELADLTGDEIGLRCTEAEFRDLAPAEETLAEFQPGYEAPVQLLAPGWQDAGGLVVDGSTIPRISKQETTGIVPPGEVEERRGDHVHATDGEIGHLRALRIDPRSHQVAHVLLNVGHLGGRKDVAIPVGLVTGFGDGIRLSISKQQVLDLG